MPTPPETLHNPDRYMADLRQILSLEVEKEFLPRGGKLRPTDWRSGDRLWLVDLVTVAGQEQKLHQRLLVELAKGPFEGREFKMQFLDPKTGKKYCEAWS